MGNAARKARKRAGDQLVKEQKVGTPLQQRARSADERWDKQGRLSNRSAKKIADRLAITGEDKPRTAEGTPVEYITAPAREVQPPAPGRTPELF